MQAGRSSQLPVLLTLTRVSGQLLFLLVSKRSPDAHDASLYYLQYPANEESSTSSSTLSTARHWVLDVDFPPFLAAGLGAHTGIAQGH